MDWLQFCASVIGSVAWPLAVVVIVIVLRKPLTRLLGGLRKLNVRGLELDFSERIAELSIEADQVRIPEVRTSPLPGNAAVGSPGVPSESARFFEEVRALAAIDPSAAVARAWIEVERAVRTASIRLGLDKDVPLSQPRTLMRVLHARGVIDDETYQIVTDLSVLRNQAVHPSASQCILKSNYLY